MRPGGRGESRWPASPAKKTPTTRQQGGYDVQMTRTAGWIVLGILVFLLLVVLFSIQTGTSSG